MTAAQNITQLFTGYKWPTTTITYSFIRTLHASRPSRAGWKGTSRTAESGSPFVLDNLY